MAITVQQIRPVAHVPLVLGVLRRLEVAALVDDHARYGYRANYLTPTDVAKADLEEPLLMELGRVITAGACIEASFQRGKGEAGMDEYQVRT